MKCLAVLALPLLAACSAGGMYQPFIPLAATETTFTAELYGAFIYDPYGGRAQRYQAAVLAAEDHCRRHGRTARLISDNEVGLENRRLAFACDRP